MTDKKSNRVLVKDPEVQKLIDLLPRWQEFVQKAQNDWPNRVAFAKKVFGKALADVEASRKKKQ